MSEYTKSTDKVDERGFINKDKILQYVSEEEIFELVFGFKPVELDYVTSPFRTDKNPGCWFETDITNGKLKFRDFAYGDRPLDCFDAVQSYFRLPNFYKTLEFIKAKLIDGKDIKHDIKHVRPVHKRASVKKKEVKILINTRDFNSRDKKYWSKYEISKQNLIDDKVFPVQKYKVTNTKSGDLMFRIYDICYAYTNFGDSRMKLYRPFQKGKAKFLTNCKANDIGGINSLVPYGRQLVISKSYKDYRVLKNQGLNVIWFQNEGMFPSNDILFPILDRFYNIVILFDNDEAGIKAGNKLKELINSNYPNRSRSLCVPIKYLEENIKDPADLIAKKGKETLNQFLKDKKIKL